MFQFSTTCVDNFFKHPDEIVYLAETLDYKPHSEGLWPGARSPELHQVNPALKTAICTKYLKLHLSSAPMIGYQCVAYFQKIGAASGGLGKGWVHNDTPHLHTTIIYLNKHENLKSGTSLYRPKKGIGPMYTTRHNMKKREFNLGKLSTKEAEKYRTESNADFEETIRFSNVYNRCIGFDACEWHAANEFSQNIKEPRLTLIIFWNEISSGQTGLQRSEMEII
jgi:hypothetical protein|tara:strand:- start:113 stop:781 length:669 start_codon:yes stop_codon:yes gene_type:complete